MIFDTGLWAVVEIVGMNSNMTSVPGALHRRTGGAYTVGVFFFKEYAAYTEGHNVVDVFDAARFLLQNGISIG